MDATPINALPDNPAMLKQLLMQERLQRAAEVAARDQQITQIKEEAANQIEAMKQKHQAEVEALLRQNYRANLIAHARLGLTAKHWCPFIAQI